MNKVEELIEYIKNENLSPNELIELISTASAFLVLAGDYDTAKKLGDIKKSINS